MIVPRPVVACDDDRFWELLDHGSFCIQKCLSCSQVRYPAEPVCGNCLSRDSDWVSVHGTGRLLAWCTFHKQYFACLPVPYTVVAVELAEGPIVCARLAGSGSAQLMLDTPMQLALEPIAFEDGSTGTGFAWRIGSGREHDRKEGES
jgi:hypothetical protein